MNECSVCSKLFSTPSNLRKHIKKRHPTEKDELLDKICYYKNSKQFKFACECGKNFNYIHHFKSHKKVHASEIKDTSYKKKCPLCDYSKFNKLKMLDHFKDSHGVNIESRELEFSSLGQFTMWKSDVEMETYSRYLQNSKDTIRSSDIFEVIYFCCHRSGTYVPKGKGKRQLKSKGSNKINGYCPAGIKLKKLNNGMCKVNFIETHIGHETELGRLQLTPSERKDLAMKIAAGFTFEKIIEEIRQSADPVDTKRIHLLTKKDLYNIQICFNQQSAAVKKANIKDNENYVKIIPKNDNENDVKIIPKNDNIVGNNEIIQLNLPLKIGIKENETTLEEKKQIIMLEFSKHLNAINSNEELENLRTMISSCNTKSLLQN